VKITRMKTGASRTKESRVGSIPLAELYLSERGVAAAARAFGSVTIRKRASKT
jgi:hypothetical protein